MIEVLMMARSSNPCPCSPGWGSGMGGIQQSRVSATSTLDKILLFRTLTIIMSRKPSDTILKHSAAMVPTGPSLRLRFKNRTTAICSNFNMSWLPYNQENKLILEPSERLPRKNCGAIMEVAALECVLFCWRGLENITFFVILQCCCAFWAVIQFYPQKKKSKTLCTLGTQTDSRSIEFVWSQVNIWSRMRIFSQSTISSKNQGKPWKQPRNLKNLPKFAQFAKISKILANFGKPWQILLQNSKKKGSWVPSWNQGTQAMARTHFAFWLH